MAASRERHAEEAASLRRLGLTVREVAQLLGVSERAVYRRTAGIDCTPTFDAPDRLATPRARSIWLAMQRQRAHRANLAVDVLERRVARVVALAGVDRPEGRDVGACAATGAEARLRGEA